MTREQASSIIAANRRFRVSRGRIVVRDAELASVIASVKAERQTSRAPTQPAFVVG